MTRRLIDTNDELPARAQVVATNARRQFLADARSGSLADAIAEDVTDQAWRRQQTDQRARS